MPSLLLEFVVVVVFNAFFLFLQRLHCPKVHDDVDLGAAG